MGILVGTVGELRRYPVKSMLGEVVRSGEVTERGLDGDRTLALVHRETGRIASAKSPRQWRDLLTITAVAGDGAVRITLPDGTALLHTDAAVDDVLSEYLGQPVTLTDSVPPGTTLDRAVPEEVLRAGISAEVPVEASNILAGTFFDFAPIHLLTTATVDHIGSLSGRGVVEAARYRPNIVISGGDAGFVENDWVGRELRIGDELTLRVVVPTPRCALPTLAHGDLPRDTDALRVPARHNRIAPLERLGPQPCAGVYAQVVHAGRISAGDGVHLM